MKKHITKISIGLVTLMFLLSSCITKDKNMYQQIRGLKEPLTVKEFEEIFGAGQQERSLTKTYKVVDKDIQYAVRLMMLPPRDKNGVFDIETIKEVAKLNSYDNFEDFLVQTCPEIINSEDIETFLWPHHLAEKTKKEADNFLKIEGRKRYKELKRVMKSLNQVE